MKIALVSNGPSASKAAGLYPGKAAYDLVIGVNKVPTIYPCDWWVFTDFRTYCKQWENVHGEPRICCKRQAGERIERELVGRPHVEYTVAKSHGGVVRYDEITPLPPKWPDLCEWLSWTGCAALVFAASFKPEVIDVFGVDLEGSKDLRNEDDFTRDRHRWPQERPLWDRLLVWVRDECGLNVNWIRLEDGN